jgi:hypothetical protein
VSRRAIALAAVVVAAFFAVTLLTLTHIVTSGNQGCAIPAPLPDLPAQLRALGGFDQSFDAGDAQQLAQVAANAAAAVDPDLDGTIPLPPVAVRALDGGQPEALMIPLQARQTSGTGMRVAGLVSFFVGCGGRAYFGSVVDLSSGGAGAGRTFPVVDAASAAGELGTSTPQLVYTTSPFMPEWRDAQSGATIPAGE